MKAREIKVKMLESYENAIELHKTMLIRLDDQHNKIRRIEYELRMYFDVEKKHNFGEE